MSMQAFMSKLKELKMKMAELENMEEALPPGDEVKADAAEGAPMEDMEEKIGLDKPDEVDEVPPGDQVDDEELMSMFGKKKKPVPKAGMKIAIAVGKPKMSPAMGKYK